MKLIVFLSFFHVLFSAFPVTDKLKNKKVMPEYSVHTDRYLGQSYDQYQYYQTEHFTIACTGQTEHLVFRAAEIAEDTYTKLAPFFGYKSSRRIALVLHDNLDDPNGYAFQYLRGAGIYARRSLFLWRGHTDWLRTAISHELSHIYSLRSMSGTFQVVTGISGDFDAAIPAEVNFSMQMYADLPLWLVEGMAQLGSYHIDADSRDPQREMLLFDALRNNLLLDEKAMNRFEGTSREYELLYNQGFDLLLFLVKKYPEKSINEFCTQIKKSGFSAGFRKTWGISFSEAYKQWRSSLPERFASREIINNNELLFPSRLKTCTIESAALGRSYAIANWQHDYEVYDLHKTGKLHMAGKSLIQKTGPHLAFDKKRNLVYFLKLVQSSASDTPSYDVFSFSAGGRSRLERITENARCLNLDAADGTLFYTSYDHGKTSLTAFKNGVNIKLAEFSYDEPVYSIAALSSRDVLFTAGFAEKVRLLRWRSGEISVLFPEQNILECAAFDEENVMISSTIDGSPQVYLVNLNSPSEWKKISFAAGARFPRADRMLGAGVWYYSEYSSGTFRLVKVNMNTGRPEIMISPGEFSADYHPAAAVTNRLILKPARAFAGNIAMLPVPVMEIAYSWNRKHFFLFVPGIYWAFININNNFYMESSARYTRYSVSREMQTDIIMWNLSPGWRMRRVNFSGNFSGYYYTDLSRSGRIWKFFDRQYNLTGDFSRSAGLYGTFHWGMDHNWNNDHFSITRYYTGIGSVKNTDLQYDEATLVPSHRDYYFRQVLAHSRYGGSGNSYNGLNWISDNKIFRGRTFFSSKMSVYYGLQFSGGIPDVVVYPDLESFGNNPFGVPSLLYLGGFYDFRFNPFVNPEPPVFWYERMSMALRIDLGINESDLLVGIEPAFRMRFYLYKAQPASLFIKFRIVDISNRFDWKFSTGLSI